MESPNLLINLQDKLVAKLVNGKNRSQGLVSQNYRRQARKLGYTDRQITAQIRDCFDMANLYRSCQRETSNNKLNAYLGATGETMRPDTLETIANAFYPLSLLAPSNDMGQRWYTPETHETNVVFTCGCRASHVRDGENFKATNCSNHA